MPTRRPTACAAASAASTYPPPPIPAHQDQRVSGGGACPRARSLIHSPDAVIHSPAEIVAGWPTTVTRSRWPHAFALRTQNPFSLLWKVTRPTKPARTSLVEDSGVDFMKPLESPVLSLRAPHRGCWGSLPYWGALAEWRLSDAVITPITSKSTISAHRSHRACTRQETHCLFEEGRIRLRPR
jgi:hypothetical protein